MNYINYEEYFVPEDNTLWPFIHKRQEFDYEKELRAVIADSPPKVNNALNYGLQNKKRGTHINISINTLIQSVYTNPLADVWFTDLVKNVTRKYGYQFEVKKSRKNLFHSKKF